MSNEMSGMNCKLERLVVPHTICETFDKIESLMLDGDTVAARMLLRSARKMGERMEARLLRYRRAVECLGFTRDNDQVEFQEGSELNERNEL